MQGMTPDTRSQESTTLRVLRWYGLGASTRSRVWAGFRRVTITAAVLVMVVMLIFGSAAGGSPESAGIRDAEEVLYIVPAVWAIFIAAVTLPGVVRLLRQRLHR